MLVAK
jgi:hypothetical protein